MVRKRYLLGMAKRSRHPSKEIEEAITQMNAKVAQKNIAVLHQGINDAKANA